MLRNYLLIAIRNLMRQRLYTFINIFGLAIGLACCTLIYLFVHHEQSYDRFHKNAHRIYRVVWDGRLGHNSWTIPVGPVPVADALVDVPEVDRVTRLRREGRTVRKGSDYLKEDEFLFVEQGFSDVFSIDFVAGDPQSALSGPDAVVLAEPTAYRYFPDGDALGGTLELSDGTALKVTGVVKAFPAQSHFHFDFLAPLNTLPIFERRRQTWRAGTVYTYLALREGAQPGTVESRMGRYIEDHGPAGWDPDKGSEKFLLQPLTDIHLRSHLEIELEPNGDIRDVYLFSLVAAFILALACINYVNLATARSVNRAREVGVRKALGSTRRQLVRQFMLESCLSVAIAVVLAIVFSQLGLPVLNSLSGRSMGPGSLGSPSVVAALAATAMVVAVVAGCYPALYLSAYRPIQVLKTGATSGFGRNRLRDALVVLQFGISIALLVSTLVIWSQLQYAQTKKLGFDREHVLVVQDTRSMGKSYRAFRQELAALPQVVSVSACGSLPGDRLDSQPFKPEQPANFEVSSLKYVLADEHFVETLGLRIVEGRNFLAGDFEKSVSAFLINQTAARTLGWQEPIGRQLKVHRYMEGPVVGVVEDFHFGSLREEIGPLVIPYLNRNPYCVAVRLGPGEVSEGISAVRQVWKDFVSNHPFQYSFLDEYYGKLYETERRTASVLGSFSALAIFIACLGLFGLAAFTAEQRTKEVGIRKALGASVSSIAVLLSGQSVKLILVANAVAWPVTYYAMDRWLMDFAYRAQLSPSVFFTGGMLALLLALLTVNSQALRAALRNPVEALRYE